MQSCEHNCLEKSSVVFEVFAFSVEAVPQLGEQNIVTMGSWRHAGKLVQIELNSIHGKVYSSRLEVAIFSAVC